MDENKKNELLKEYSDRHSFWTQLALTQFGYSINLFTTIGISFIGYLIFKRDFYPDLILNIHLDIHWGFVFYLITIIILFISILLGLIAIVSRLYDLRLTRHIIRIRRRTLEDKNELLNNTIIDNELKFCTTFLKIIFCKIEFINEDDFVDLEKLELKFIHIREMSVILGKYSWIMHKIQIVLFIFSVIIYGLNVII